MKVVTADQAAALIASDWAITTGGFGHCGSPEALLKAIERRFQTCAAPSGLTLFFASGPGDRLQQGINRLAHPGLIRRIIGGFWSLAPRIGEMALANDIEAHNWPQGVVSHMFRAIAGGQPGVVTSVGLGTFIDPEQSGGQLNRAGDSTPLVQRVDLAGAPALLYRALPIQCALLRGSRADQAGNISMEREANVQDVLAQAQAVRNSGGIVIVQVQQITSNGSLPQSSVKIPGFLVDYVVVAQAEDHWQTYGEEFNPSYSGQWQGYVAEGAPVDPHEQALDAKRIIARRALLELTRLASQPHRGKPLVVNLGIGTPEFIAQEARRSGLLPSHLFTLTVESGAIGGIPAGGLSFGASAFPDAVLSQAELFDYYDGGGIDLAFLGFGQLDAKGRINVASLGGRLNGVGGFVNISQAAQRLVFCGSFTAGGLQVRATHAGLEIIQEGQVRKLVPEIQRICYDPSARSTCRHPLLITERGVLQISSQGLTLIEVAPGVDPVRDVQAAADVPIQISADLVRMPPVVFGTSRMSYPFTT